MCDFVKCIRDMYFLIYTMDPLLKSSLDLIKNIYNLLVTIDGVAEDAKIQLDIKQSMNKLILAKNEKPLAVMQEMSAYFELYMSKIEALNTNYRKLDEFVNVDQDLSKLDKDVRDVVQEFIPKLRQVYKHFTEGEKKFVCENMYAQLKCYAAYKLAGGK